MWTQAQSSRMLIDGTGRAVVDLWRAREVLCSSSSAAMSSSRSKSQSPAQLPLRNVRYMLKHSISVPVRSRKRSAMSEEKDVIRIKD